MWDQFWGCHTSTIEYGKRTVYDTVNAGPDPNVARLANGNQHVGRVCVMLCYCKRRPENVGE